MPKFRRLPSENSCPKVDWFTHLDLPKGRTYKCDRREVINLDHIERHNENGQIVNLARQLGTDKENCLLIANNIKVNGVLLDAQPPFISTENVLFDGFTRFDAFKLLGITHWVYNVVEPKKGFTWEDVRDEIGLGANNHPPSKSASEKDFERRLCYWISLQDKTPTHGACIDWINNIPNSFTDERIAKIARNSLNTNATKNSMESLEAPDVIRKTNELINLNEKTKVIPVNISGNKTYFHRVAFEKINSICNKKVSDTYMVGYTKNISAEDVAEVRENGLEYAERINENFENAFQERLKKGESFKLIDIKAFAPQIIGVEDGLVDIDKKGS